MRCSETLTFDPLEPHTTGSCRASENCRRQAGQVQLLEFLRTKFWATIVQASRTFAFRGLLITAPLLTVKRSILGTDQFLVQLADAGLRNALHKENLIRHLPLGKCLGKVFAQLL